MLFIVMELHRLSYIQALWINQVGLATIEAGMYLAAPYLIPGSGEQWTS